MPRDIPEHVKRELKLANVKVVADFANEAVYFKAKGGVYGLGDARFGFGLTDKEKAGVELVYNAADAIPPLHPETRKPIGPAPFEYGPQQSVWWVDLNLWPHLIHPLVHCYKWCEGEITTQVAMNWDPWFIRPQIWEKPHPPDKVATGLTLIGLHGTTVLTVKFDTAFNMGRAGWFLDALGNTFPDCVYASQQDPRHMGTHFGLGLGSQNTHYHLVRTGSWKDDIDTVARIALGRRLLTIEEAKSLVFTIAGRPFHAIATASPPAPSTQTLSPQALSPSPPPA